MKHGYTGLAKTGKRTREQSIPQYACTDKQIHVVSSHGKLVAVPDREVYAVETSKEAVLRLSVAYTLGSAAHTVYSPFAQLFVLALLLNLMGGHSRKLHHIMHEIGGKLRVLRTCMNGHVYIAPTSSRSLYRFFFLPFLHLLVSFRWRPMMFGTQHATPTAGSTRALPCSRR